jgi:hypothetical protein
MNKATIQLLILLCSLCFISSKVNANEFCDTPLVLSASNQFSGAVKEAQLAYDKICKSLNSGAIKHDELYEILYSFHQILSSEAKSAMPALADHLGTFQNPLIEIINGEISPRAPSYMVNREELSVTSITLFAQGKNNILSNTIPTTPANTCLQNTACRKSLDEYIKLVENVYSPFALAPILLVEPFLLNKDREWMDYIDNARAQTYFDIGITTWLYEIAHGKEPDIFSSPPQFQYFTLRPMAIIENVNEAVDGQQTKSSLALEVFGVNAWNDACLGYACGTSFIITHVDRAEVDKFGWGFAFHVENDFSFGFTKHGDDTGFFVTVDLLKLIIDKKSSFKQYKEGFRQNEN